MPVLNSDFTTETAKIAQRSQRKLGKVKGGTSDEKKEHGVLFFVLNFGFEILDKSMDLIFVVN